MAVLLVLAFLLVPIAELAVIVTVAKGIGVLETIGLLILVSVVGAWLVRRQGVTILNRIQSQLRAGTMPTKELVDGGLVMFAGALMLTPGFLTDLLALLLLLPPTRVPIRGLLMRRFRSRVEVIGTAGPMGGVTFGTMGRHRRPMDVIDLNRVDETEDRSREKA